MVFAIKTGIEDPTANQFAFARQKTMYGGRQVAEGDTVEAVPKRTGIPRQTPRVSLTIRRVALAKRRLGRTELKRFADWNDGRPETELNFKFYRQATNKIIGISDETAAFLGGFF